MDSGERAGHGHLRVLRLRVNKRDVQCGGNISLRLTASDGALTSSSDETVVVNVASQAPSGSVTVNAGDNVQSLVDSKTGTTFYFNPGIYRGQSIAPKDRDIFIGASGAILNGADLVTSFTREGSYWVVSNQNQSGTRTGSCLPEMPRCSYPEDFFIDGVPLQHVDSLAKVGRGKYFFDYTQRKIYFSDDPPDESWKRASARGRSPVRRSTSRSQDLLSRSTRVRGRRAQS